MNNYVLLILVFLAIGFVQSLSNAAPSNHVDPSEPIFDADIEPLVDTKEDGSRREGADEYSYMESLDNRVAHEGLDIRMVSEEENKGPYHLPEEFAVSRVNNETDIEKVLNEHQEEVEELKEGLEYITSWNATATRYYDCQVHYNRGARINGVYEIHPAGLSEPINVFCDFFTGAEGWTVIMRRAKGYPAFYRDWDDYVRGFGLPANDHWLGLDNIHYLSTQKRYKLRLDLYDCGGSHRFAEYNHFALGPPGTNYELLIGKYSGDAGDSLSYHRSRPFSTFERDNDANSANCAQRYKGGWWYNGCYEANLNGIYYDCDQGPPGATGIAWKTFKGFDYSLARVEMKILPL